MLIAEVSKKYDIPADTLRYYEKMGLLAPHRKASGIRDYDETDLATIAFLKCMRSAGLSLSFLQKYMELYRAGDKTVGERIDLLKEQRALLLEKKDSIDESLSRLDYKIKHYEEIMPQAERAMKGKKI